MVGVTGFEPATPCTPCKYSTRLSYTPNNGLILPQQYKNYKYFFWENTRIVTPAPLRLLFFRPDIIKQTTKRKKNVKIRKQTRQMQKLLLRTWRKLQQKTRNGKKGLQQIVQPIPPRFWAGMFLYCKSIQNRIK